MEEGDVRLALEEALPALRSQDYEKIVVFTLGVDVNDIVTLD